MKLLVGLIEIIELNNTKKGFTKYVWIKIHSYFNEGCPQNTQNGWSFEYSTAVYNVPLLGKY